MFRMPKLLIVLLFGLAMSCKEKKVSKPLLDGPIGLNPQEINSSSDKAVPIEPKLKDTRRTLDKIPAPRPTPDSIGSTAVAENLEASISMVDHKLVLISDIDDTIKITDILHISKWQLFKNANGHVEFYGMSKLYNVFKNTNAKRAIFYVSAAPVGVHELGKETLERNRFPNGPGLDGVPSSCEEDGDEEDCTFENLIYRKSISSTQDYKIEASLKIIATLSKDSKYILVGDNGERDVFVYDAVKIKKPDVVFGTYIHHVYASSELGAFEIKPYQTRYLTVADLAASFYKDGIISKKDLNEILGDFLTNFDKVKERIIPEFMGPACVQFMKQFWPTFKASQELEEKLKLAQEKVRSLASCKANL